MEKNKEIKIKHQKKKNNIQSKTIDKVIIS